jgi:hypothetical protein
VLKVIYSNEKHFTFEEKANVFYFKDLQVPNHEFTFSYPTGTECRAQQYKRGCQGRIGKLLNIWIK